MTAYDASFLIDLEQLPADEKAKGNYCYEYIDLPLDMVL